MNIEYIARKVDLTDQIRQLTEKKLSRLEKYFNQILDIRVEFEQERHLYVVNVVVNGKDFDTRSRAQNKDLRTAIQEAIDRLDNQARKAKTRLKGRKRQAEEAMSAPDWSVDVLTPESVSSGEPRIVKTSTITVKPMTIEEAMLQLERSRNEFIVFLNAATDRVNVLYRRQDKNLGLITPEL
ncbi:MAG: ribosome-associated translation inhibitor RaiA [Acidobacteria bacterium]|jgi:putative sigma-54 modulation protein|nr:ribosome-associated translation inhibitor RaiA [Acidobacteriota bacterium]